MNNSNEKINPRITLYKKGNKNSNKIKNILIQGNNKNINSFDNEYINQLRKENERLKKLIIRYENINPNNNNKKIQNILKMRNYLINNRIKKISENNKRSISKTNSNENSYIMKAYNNRNLPSKNNKYNKSSILTFMKQDNSINHKNNFTDYSMITDSSLIISKNKKILEIPKNNKIYNTINVNNTYKKVLKKNNTNVNTISGRIGKNINSNITKKKMINRLKVKCSEALLKEKNNKLLRDKIMNKLTPKNSIKNNDSFFAHSNHNYIKNKNNKMRSFKLIGLDNNFINININDIKNNTATYHFFNENSKDNGDKNQNDILKTEVNSNSNLIIHRNSGHQNSNKSRIMKEFKTEKNDFNENNDEIYFPNDNNLTYNGIPKIKINRKNIFFKKSQNSLRDAINNQNKNVKLNRQNINSNDNEVTNNYQLFKSTIINNKIKRNILLEDKKINNNCLGSKKFIKNINTDKKLSFSKTNKFIDKKTKIPALRNNQIKSQSNTINNISNFNNCNYIYLFNNDEKFIKINKQTKA